MTACKRRPQTVLCGALVLTLIAASAQAQSIPPPPKLSTVGSELGSDFKYLVNNVSEDAIDVVRSPLHIKDTESWISNPRFYLIVGGSLALFGGAFAMDKVMKANLRSMSPSDATLLQDISYDSVSVGTGLMYAWGLYSGDARARQYAITAGEGAGVATLADIGIKAAFGRLRPRQSSSHLAFFDGGASFVSGDVTPMFALATGVSEYFDNRWYVATPVYSLALLDGFGRMGHNAHWFSDVVGAALLGTGTTELLLWMHKRHEIDPHRFKIFAVSAPTPTTAQGNVMPTGMGFAFAW
ncbi:MAG TPA: phosphatase PAP2 family protein [Candidatus Binataceae bacterium]|nr:phosphatase PAP2 family protein [Candidatus Binataceae bacterium]